MKNTQAPNPRNERSPAIDRLDTILMSEGDRARARATMQHAEAFVDLIVAAQRGLRVAMSGVRDTAAVVRGRLKSRPAGPAHR